MNTHIDSALRSLDAAAGTTTAAQREREEAVLDRIVATPPEAGDARTPVPGSRRRISRRLVAISVAAAVLAVGSVVVPGLGRDDAAYATWSATPTTVSASDLDHVKAACQERLGTYVADDSSPVQLDAGAAKLPLAERRGDYVALLYRWDDPDMSILCLARNPQGSPDVDDIHMSAGGSSGPALKAPPRGFTQGAIAQFGNPKASITDGAVGDDVVGVTIHAGSVTVEATVKNGRYVAWWPGAAFDDGPAQPSGKGGPEPLLTYDLTLTDGTVILDAEPTLPS